MSEYSVRKYNELVVWESEVEWLYRLMPASVLLQLKDVIDYAINEKEYERCPISCGCMRFLIYLIEKEMRIRVMEEGGITYKEASEKIIAEHTYLLDSVKVEGKDDRSNGTDIDTSVEEGKTDSI